MAVTTSGPRLMPTRWAKYIPPTASPQITIGAEGWSATAVARPDRESPARSVPVAASQILRVLSLLAETIQVPFVLTAHAVTQSVCPVRVVRSVPVATSQIFKVSSQLADTIHV